MGIFDEDWYWDIFIEIVKEDDDLDEFFFCVIVWNRGLDFVLLYIVFYVWFCNMWVWGCELFENKLVIGVVDENFFKFKYYKFGDCYVFFLFLFGVGFSGDDVYFEFMFIENDINYELFYKGKNEQLYVKDVFYRYIVDGEKGVINLVQMGIKVVVWYFFNEGGGVGFGECVGMFIFFYFFFKKID